MQEVGNRLTYAGRELQVAYLEDPTTIGCVRVCVSCVCHCEFVSLPCSIECSAAACRVSTHVTSSLTDTGLTFLVPCRESKPFYFVKENGRGAIYDSYVKSIDFISRFIHDSQGDLTSGKEVFGKRERVATPKMIDC